MGGRIMKLLPPVVIRPEQGVPTVERCPDGDLAFLERLFRFLQRDLHTGLVPGIHSEAPDPLSSTSFIIINDRAVVKTPAGKQSAAAALPRVKGRLSTAVRVFNKGAEQRVRPASGGHEDRHGLCDPDGSVNLTGL
jgi:hypothetical protein